MTLEHVILLFLLPQQIAQFEQPKPQAGLDRAKRLAQSLGDLGAGHAAIVGQLDRLALVGGQLLERRAHSVAQQPLTDLALRSDFLTGRGKLASSVCSRARARSRLLRVASIARWRVMPSSHEENCPTPGWKLPAACQTFWNTSCTTSSAVSRSPVIRSATV